MDLGADSGFITVAAAAEDEFYEKKSRFIGQICPAADEGQAQAFLEQVRARRRDANHHCYAWIVGDNDQFQRSSDAGEPAGTAGRPILEALKRAQLHQTALVVTRYFGGVLLGAGGLTRAYGKAAQLAIARATLVRRLPACRYALSFDYGLLGKVETFLLQNQLQVENKLYAEQVCFICLLAQDQLAAVTAALADLSNGGLRCQELEGQATLDLPLNRNA